LSTDLFEIFLKKMMSKDRELHFIQQKKMTKTCFIEPKLTWFKPRQESGFLVNLLD